MALNVPTFLKRLGSSVVFVAIMLTGLLWNEWAFYALMCLIQVLCLRDYFRLMASIDKEAARPKWIPVTLQVIGMLLLSLFFFRSAARFDAALWMGAYLLPLLPAVLLLASVLSKKVALPSLLQSAGGLLYIVLPMIMLLQMRIQSMFIPISLIVMIWSNDTMAYLVGSFFGKHPFSPISPRKTWEGTIGGALITIIAAGIVGYCTHTFRIVDWMMLALCATVAGTLGDLLESKLKRLADVKDSGNLMPGHGGALDRFDSLLIATPFAFVYVICFMR